MHSTSILNNRTLQKSVYTLMCIGFALWFGGSMIRTAIAYDLFIPGIDMVLKPDLDNSLRMHSVRLFSNLFLYTNTGYGLVFIGALFTLIAKRKEMKQYGWLFMALVLFFMASPIELYMHYLDWQLSFAFYYDNVSDFMAEAIQDNFVARFKTTSITVFSSLGFLATLTSMIFVIWKPLNKPDKLQEGE